MAIVEKVVLAVVGLACIGILLAIRLGYREWVLSWLRRMHAWMVDKPDSGH